MSEEVQAVYENGVFRPLEPVQWAEQQRVRVCLEKEITVEQSNEWTEEKNRRRCELIDKEIAGTLSGEEGTELEGLQQAMLAYRRQVAPLPLDDLRALHQELLDGVGKQQKGS